MALIDNLISYYKFDENAANTTVADAHGSNTGTSSTNTSNLYDAAGVINSAFDFVRANSEYVEITNDASLNTDNLTINWWMKLDSMGANGADRAMGKENVQWLQLVNLGSEYYFEIRLAASPGTARTVTNATGWETGVWHMHTITYDGTDLKYYIDGGNVQSNAYSGAIKTSTANIFLGSHRAGNGWIDGKMDEVGIWSEALTSGEIIELYNSGSGLAYPFTTGTNMQVNIGDAWKSVDAVKINIGDVWKVVEGMQVNIGDVWKTIF